MVDVYRPEALAELSRPPGGQGVARGLGRSYGDAGIGRDFAVDMTRLDRMVDFVDGRLTVEAGVSLREIVETWLPRGWFLPVTPGTQWVTVGGAISSDVHGKNHHGAGSFGRYVRSVLLYTADGHVRRCSPQENADLFWALVGGMGLVGIILQAEIELLPVESEWMVVDYVRTRHLEETLAWFRERGQQTPYNVAFVDPMSTGARLGRAVVMAGRHATLVDGQPPASRPGRMKKAPPLPSLLLRSRWLGSMANAAYWRAPRPMRRWESVISYFYPLDALADWYRIYGKKGFTQFQTVLPIDISSGEMERFFTTIRRFGHSAYTGVLKIMGDASPGLLSFPRPGFTLAIDIPWYGSRTRDLLQTLYDMTLDFGGRVYLAKDTCLGGDRFRRMYPLWERFMEMKARVDPDDAWVSEQSIRLGLTRGGEGR